MPTTSDRAGLCIVSIGSCAAHALERDRHGTVAAVFEHTIHIAVDDDIVCIGGPAIGNGPLNAILAEPLRSNWTATIEPGEPIEIAGRAISLRRSRLDAVAARTWRPAPWPRTASIDAIRTILDQLTSIVAARSPFDGLVRLAVCGEQSSQSAQATALSNLAAPRIAALASWMAGSCCDAPASARRQGDEKLLGIVSLLGLGPGLTPSGDDLLAGGLIALRAVGAAATARQLAEVILPASPQATTLLSSAFLAAAAKGEGSAALHTFISAVIAARHDQLHPAVEALGRIGHTSGWDALAGACLALTAWASAHPPTRSP